MKCYLSRMDRMPGEAVTRAWARLIRAQHIALSRVETALKQAGLPPLSWYDVLLEVERAGKAGTRPFEIERRLLLPQYGLSRLLDRIVSAGYIVRRPCGADGRGQIVAITRAGKAMRRRMWPVYGGAISCAIGERLSEEEAETLGELLGRLSAPASHRPQG
jgi:DNA-binding MarR family transcriptional regulator